jgi:hypothetical protein
VISFLQFECVARHIFQRKKLCGIAKKFGFFIEGNEGNEECIGCNERQPLFSLLSSVERECVGEPPVRHSKRWRGKPRFSLELFGSFYKGKEERSRSSETQPLFSSLSSVEKVHLGARELTIFSKRGSPRSGSQNGNNFSWP